MGQKVTIDEFEIRVRTAVKAAKARGIVISSGAWGSLMLTQVVGSDMCVLKKFADVKYCCALGAVALEDPSDPTADEGCVEYLARILDVSNVEIRAFVEGFDNVPSKRAYAQETAQMYQLGQKLYLEFTRE